MFTTDVWSAEDESCMQLVEGQLPYYAKNQRKESSGGGGELGELLTSSKRKKCQTKTELDELIEKNKRLTERLLVLISVALVMLFVSIIFDGQLSSFEPWMYY